MYLPKTLQIWCPRVALKGVDMVLSILIPCWITVALQLFCGVFCIPRWSCVMLMNPIFIVLSRRRFVIVKVELIVCLFSDDSPSPLLCWLILHILLHLTSPSPTLTFTPCLYILNALHLTNQILSSHWSAQQRGARAETVLSCAVFSFIVMYCTELYWSS